MAQVYLTPEQYQYITEMKEQDAKFNFSKICQDALETFMGNDEAYTRSQLNIAKNRVKELEEQLERIIGTRQEVYSGKEKVLLDVYKAYIHEKERDKQWLPIDGIVYLNRRYRGVLSMMGLTPKAAQLLFEDPKEVGKIKEMAK
jgi:hypothetical protein